MSTEGEGGASAQATQAQVHAHTRSGYTHSAIRCMSRPPPLAHQQQRPLRVLCRHLKGEALHHGLLDAPHIIKDLALLLGHRLHTWRGGGGGG